MDTTLLKEKCGIENYKKLERLSNEKVMDFVSKYIKLFNPGKVFVRTDSDRDAEYIRKKAIENKEERSLATDGHTVHFDGYFDQARDKVKTMYLLRPDEVLGSDIRSTDREKGLREIHNLFENAMKHKEVYICFYCLEWCVMAGFCKT